MKNFSKIASVVLIGINTTIILAIGAPALAVISIMIFNTGLSIANFLSFFKYASIVGILLFSLIISIYCRRRDKNGTSIFIGILIFITIIISIAISLITYESMTTG